MFYPTFFLFFLSDKDRHIDSFLLWSVVDSFDMMVVIIMVVVVVASMKAESIINISIVVIVVVIVSMVTVSTVIISMVIVSIFVYCKSHRSTKENLLGKLNAYHVRARNRHQIS